MPQLKTIYNLSFNEHLSQTQGHLTYTWLRVPGGWNLTVESDKGITNTFIPQSNEFKELARELENRSTDFVSKKIVRDEIRITDTRS